MLGKPVEEQANSTQTAPKSDSNQSSSTHCCIEPSEAGTEEYYIGQSKSALRENVQNACKIGTIQMVADAAPAVQMLWMLDI